ncbi:tubulin folding cofactor D C terminal-domain-containing protein [Flammula alnicola]|nr:tubulin folding cofactor D C terminal-domain-containing protein [Flammula alnicola]
MAENVGEEKVLATFETVGELRKLQDALLSLDWSEDSPDAQHDDESVLFQKFSVMLDEYQEQSYLLDPYLEDMVAPVVERLKDFAKACIANPSLKYSPWRVDTIARVLYSYILPHEIADLSIALEFMQIPDGLAQHRYLWAMRYVTLLWLYIICIIPFDFAQFDELDRIGETASSLETVAKRYLGAAGLEREAAALLLSRLYMRKDTGLGFHEFVVWSHSFLQENSDVFKAIGLLQVLCEVVKSGSVEQAQAELPQLLSISSTVQGSSTLSNNTVVRKFKTKLVSRLGLRLLPTSTGNRRQVRALIADEVHVGSDAIGEDVELLFEALQDKDTIVRWSAAKGVARIAERLPKDFCSQVLETVMGLFEIHSVAAASLYDLPAVAEGTWHGACLACAEIARRSLVEPGHLPQLIEWLSKALYFDLRKGAHSIGSNVRDAAAYVLWALARTQNQSALIPHASNLARRLATVALYDREIHIRRAASAAFQEHVGRNSLFPHGIDVLAKTDFYAVSIRKNAFLVAAPQVAEHPEYRDFLFDHLLNVVLRHWDISMRELGSQSLRLICSHDLYILAPRAIEKIVLLLESLDLADVHGGLLALSEIAIAYKETIKDPIVLEDHLRNVFKHLKHIPESTLTTTRSELIASAACRLIANSITVTEIKLGGRSSVPGWRNIVDIGLKHRMASVQETAADAMAAMSNLTDCSADSKANIETRRSCLQAIPRIMTLVSPHLASLMSSDTVHDLVAALLAGLEDYTIDERGDVGSWVRIVCIQGLTRISELLFRTAESIPDFERYLPPETYISIAAGLLKQGVERLDNVRQTAGVCFMTLLNMPLPLVDRADRWRLPASPLLRELFVSPSEQIGWNDGTWLFPRAIRLLEIPEYRKPVLSGIVISIGSKTDSTQKPVSNSLVKFSQELPLAGGLKSAYSLLDLVNDLINHAKSHMTSNAVVVPVYQTFTLLLEADALRHVPEEPAGRRSLQTLLNMTSRNVDKLKSVQRIHESMKIIVNLLTFEQIRVKTVPLLSSFLAHPFPKVRSDTAEYLYILLQSADLGFETDAVEDILLETEWSTSDIDVAKEAAKELIQHFMSSMTEI